MRLDVKRTTHAIALGAMQGAGFRQAHGNMCMGFVPGHTARAGLFAAMLARRGFTSSPQIFEGRNGFFDVFAKLPGPGALTRRLGEHFEVEENLCKPYPAGIFIHAAIDACFKVRAGIASIPDDIASVTLSVHPLGVGLTGHADAKDPYEALVSIYHWSAVALLTGRAGLDEVSDEMVADPRVMALREKIRAVPDAGLARDEARILVVLKDGRELAAHVPHAMGGPGQPLDDEAVRAKFLTLAGPYLPKAGADGIAAACAGLEALEDMRPLIRLMNEGLRPAY